jgi:hypothetical protein
MIHPKNGVRACNGQPGKKRTPNAHQTHAKRTSKRTPNAHQDARQTHIKFSWFPGSQTRFGNPLLETPFHVKIAIIFENLIRFGTPFQKVFCHSAKSQTPLAEYFSSCKALKSSRLRRPKKVFCHSAKAPSPRKKSQWQLG